VGGLQQHWFDRCCCCCYLLKGAFQFSYPAFDCSVLLRMQCVSYSFTRRHVQSHVPCICQLLSACLQSPWRLTAGIAIALQQHITNKAEAKRRHHRHRHNSAHPMAMTADSSSSSSSSSSQADADADAAAAAAAAAAAELEAEVQDKKKKWEKQPSAWESIKVG
jgi:hypothetical protein